MLTPRRGNASARRRFRPASVELRARQETPAHGAETSTVAGSGPLRRALVATTCLAMLGILAGTEARTHVATAASVVQAQVADVMDEVGLVRDRHVRAAAAADALRALERDHMRLMLEVERLRAVEREHERLADLLELRDDHEVRGIGARVLAAAGTGRRTFRIDRGTEAGLVAGMAVLSPQGVAGQVVEVGPGWSDVLSITDPSHGLHALVDDGPRGPLVGTGDALSLEHVAARAEVSVGDPVVASGVDGVFPAGARIGEVEHVEVAGPFLSIRVRPVAPPEVLSEVLIVTGPATGNVARR